MPITQPVNQSTNQHANQSPNRYFVQEQKVTFTVVPFEYDLEANPSKVEYHGVFISNGPGDPAMCTSTINSLKFLMRRAEAGDKPMPIFGICLGNQLLALAAGAKVRGRNASVHGRKPRCGSVVVVERLIVLLKRDGVVERVHDTVRVSAGLTDYYYMNTAGSTTTTTRNTVYG